MNSSPTITPYCTLEYADAYFSQRLNVEAWDAAEESTRSKALATATRQIRQFARFYDDIDRPIELDPENLPPQVPEAAAEQAIYLLTLGFDPAQPKKVNTLGILSTDGTVFDKTMTAAILCDTTVRLLENAGAEILENAGMNATGATFGRWDK